MIVVTNIVVVVVVIAILRVVMAVVVITVVLVVVAVAVKLKVLPPMILPQAVSRAHLPPKLVGILVLVSRCYCCPFFITTALDYH